MKLFKAVRFLCAFLVASRSFATEIIVDAEIDNVIRLIFNRLSEECDIEKNSIPIFVIKEPDINAYVAPGRNTPSLNVFTGVFIKMPSVDPLLALFAHEISHIKCGHIIARMMSFESGARLLVSSLIAGALLTSMGAGPFGAAAVIGGLGVAAGGVLSFTRSQESAADASAIKLLRKLNLPIDGGITLFQALLDESKMLRHTGQFGSGPKEHWQSHPLIDQRLLIWKKAAESQKVSNVSSLLREYFLFAKEKINAYHYAPKDILHQKKDCCDKYSLYAKAIAHYKLNNDKEALCIINTLIKDNPDNPFLYGTKAMFLIKTDPMQAIACYEKAISLAEYKEILRFELVQILIFIKDFKKAKDVLLSIDRKARDAMYWECLAKCYGKLQMIYHAHIAQAEKALMQYDRAALHGALGLLKKVATYDESLRQTANDLRIAIQARLKEDDS